ncbi:hypothetical protein HDK64DRAFT_261158 [Phyllosticta capitalensis]
MRYNNVKLEGLGTFRLWKRMLEFNLQIRDLWEHVNDDKPPPERPTQILSDPEAFNRWIDWRVKEIKAQNMIRLSVSNEILGRNYGDTAHALFKNLIKHYENLPVNKYALFQKWRGLQWDGTRYQEFLHEWHCALRCCVDSGIPISEEVKVLTFVDMVSRCGSSQYETWATVKIVNGLGQEVPELHRVTNEVYWLWERNRSRRLELEEQKKKCGVCGTRGHTPSSCWHLHPEIGPPRFHPKRELVSSFKKRMEIDDEDDQKDDEGDDEDSDDEDERILREVYNEVDDLFTQQRHFN